MARSWHGTTALLPPSTCGTAARRYTLSHTCFCLRRRAPFHTHVGMALKRYKACLARFTEGLICLLPGLLFHVPFPALASCVSGRAWAHLMTCSTSFISDSTCLFGAIVTKIIKHAQAMVLVCGQARNLSDPVLRLDPLFAVSGKLRSSPLQPLRCFCGPAAGCWRSNT